MKLNIKNLIIMLIGILTFMLGVSDWVLALVNNGTFTVIGLVINLAEFFVACECYEYLEDYLNNKEVK